MNYEYHAILVDDIEKDLDVLESEIEKFNSENTNNIKIIIEHKCSDVSDLLLNMSNKTALVFLDLRCGDTFKKIGEAYLKNMRPNVKVIVVSGFIEPEVRNSGYSNVIEYLDKNNRYTDLDNAIIKFWVAQEHIKSIFSSDYVKIFINNGWVHINYDDIYKIMTGSGKVIITLLNSKFYSIDANLISLSRFDGAKPLLRIANHISVNINHIHHIRQQRNRNTRRMRLKVVTKGTSACPEETFDVGPLYEIDVTKFAANRQLTFLNAVEE